MTNQDNFQDPVGPLRSKIEVWANKHAAEFPAEVLQLFARKTEEVIKSGILSQSPKIGEKVDDFELKTPDGVVVKLSEKVKEGPVILNFYRGSWCHFCTLEFQELLETVPEFRSRGASVLAISPQVNDTREIPESAAQVFVNLSDRGNEIARRFGLVYPLGDEIRKVYEALGIRLDALNGDDTYEVPVPASYLIDHDMTIRYAFASADLTERAEPEILLEEVAALAA